VVVAPRILDDQSSDVVNILEGETAALKCMAMGFPQPDIMWRFNGKKFKGN